MSSFAEVECAIRQLQGHYADSVWRMDFDSFGKCFAEDCRWTIGGVVLNGRTEIVDYNRTLFTTKFRKLLITLRTPILKVEGDKATGRTYFAGTNVLADGSAYTPTGCYYEHFTKQGGKWLFHWRLFQTHYAGPPSMKGKFFENPDYGAPPAMPPLDEVTANHTKMHAQENVGVKK